ncbi:glycosyltransferase family 4 protein [Rothia sp. CCM 9416]|uniref:glycosyltransferase family 4 protein n=1 Tax=Rothia sp. CCM 9416 TaxID=3402655 RepID=UPI003AED5C94
MKIVIASNHGAIGGGEVMLLNVARALRSLRHEVTILSPTEPGELLDLAKDEGFSTISLEARDRKSYMAQLRVWRAHHRDAFLWCNGLVPALATAGDQNRLVHLHQLPTGIQKFAYGVAKKGARLVLVPSYYVAERVPRSVAFENWVAEVSDSPKVQPQEPHVRIGFLGRPALIKGTHTLAHALKLLNDSGDRRYELLIGGEAKFIDASSQEKVNLALDHLGDKCRLLGWVDPGELFSQSDILVVPSEVDESFGLVAAEAMSARMPLIVSDAGALPEVVGRDYPWIFRQGDSLQLAEMILALDEMASEDFSASQDLLNRSYWRWFENYSPESGKARVAEIIKRIENTD